MGLNYNTEAIKLDLFAVLEDHHEWFNRLCLQLFYPFDVRSDHPLEKPTSFSQWIAGVQKYDNEIQPEILGRLSTLHSELFYSAQKLQNHVMHSQAKPEYKEFSEFVTLYEEFSITMRRLEREILAEGNGYDCVTGLRLARLAEADISKELDRLSRQGRAFCLSMVRVDRFDAICEAATKSEISAYVKLLADLIKLSLRSYDDAYYLGNGEYLLCLKQADVTGGISALERLRAELEGQEIRVSYEGSDNALMSMSCVITEPVSGELPEKLIADLRNDLLTRHLAKVDSVLQYHELSPLQKYAQGVVDGSTTSH